MSNRNLTGGTDRFLAEQYASLLIQSLGRQSLDGAVVLDFGCGRGDLLDALARRGAKAYGVEPFATEHMLAERPNLRRSLSELPAGITFSGIVMKDVIEHLSEPVSALSALRARLDLGGWVFASTPNAESLNARLAGSKWRERANPGHLVLFSARSLERALRLSGLADTRRLRWQVTYHAAGPRRAADWLLQSFGLDGDLRYLGCR